MSSYQGQLVSEGRFGFVIPRRRRHRDLVIPPDYWASRTGVMRVMVWSDHYRWVSRPRCARASSNVTSTDQRMMTQCRICAGAACRSLQKNASICSLPSGSPINTQRNSTGGRPSMYHRAMREKAHLEPSRYDIKLCISNQDVLTEGMVAWNCG